MESKIKYKRLFISFINTALFFLAWNNLYPQLDIYRNSNFTSENGLSNNSINCIYQDRYGFLWIGTDNGLNKYDGYIFTNYHTNRADSNSISSDFISSICEDINGNLWIGTIGGGFCCYDRSKQNFKNYYNFPACTNPARNNITSICADEYENIWCGTAGNGIVKFNMKDRSFKSYKNNSPDYFSAQSDIITGIVYTGNSTLLIGTTIGLIKFDFKNNLTETFLHSDSDDFSLLDNFVHTIYKDKSNQLFIGTSKMGFQSFDAETGKFRTYPAEEDLSETNAAVYINSIYTDMNDNILMSASEGSNIFILDKLTGKIKEASTLSLNSQKSTGKTFKTIFIDKTNILWIGTNNIGLDKINLNRPKFETISLENKNKISEGGRKIRAIYSNDEGNLWFGTNEGLVFYDRINKTSKLYKNFNGTANNFNNTVIEAILLDKKNNLWLGTSDAGLIKFNEKTKTFASYKHDLKDESSINSNYIRVIYEDREGILWIGTVDNGVSTFDSKTEKFNALSIAYGDSVNIQSDNISSILEDRTGEMWIGTNSAGLINYDKKSGKTVRYRFDASNKNSISSDVILSLCEDKNGELWIGTNNGLEEFDRNTKSFYHYTNKDGLIYEVINSMLVDEKNNLWMATNNGITKFSIPEKSFRNYNLFDGLQGREFYHSSCMTKSGEFFFSGVNGVNAFYPDSVIDTPNKSSIAITSFMTADRTTSYSEEISGLSEIDLKHSNNSFSLTFALLDFTNPSYYTYAYKLEGIDKTWNYGKNIRTATYSNLDPGDYTFYVKANNSDGSWSDIHSIQIIITPPFWRSWWAYTIITLSILSVAFTNFKKIYSYKKYNKILELDVFDKSQDLEKINTFLHNEISEKQKIEESLRYSEEHYRMMVENTTEAIMIFQDEKVVYTNPMTKEILDYQFEDLSLHSFLNYIHPDDRELIKNNYSNIVSDKYFKNHYSVRINRKDSKVILVEINSVKIYINGKSEILFFIKDITDRKRAEDEIKIALKKEKELGELRSRFISMTSHEFRTPLTSINTSIEILEKFSEHLTHEQKKNNLLRIHENVQHMTRLLNNVLTIGKSDAGIIKLVLEPVDINKLSSQIIDEFQTYILYKTKHKFKYETDNLKSRVLMDVGLIKQVIENLISNSIKYSDDGTTIYFKLKFNEKFIIFSVKDEGYGIPEEDIFNLFEPFYRASNIADISGSGLGLTIVKRAVELHNGNINVVSKVGEGSEFIVTIPLIKVV